MPIRDSIDKHAEAAAEDISRLERAKEGLRAKGSLSLPWRAAPIVGHLADAATTEMFLREGGHEKNERMKGLVQKPLLNALVKAGIGAGFSVLANEAGKKNKFLGKVLSGASAAPPALAAIHNVGIIRKLRAGKKVSGK